MAAGTGIEEKKATVQSLRNGSDPTVFIPLLPCSQIIDEEYLSLIELSLL